ncbi:MAG: hypothetical protein KAT34_15000 [Candidatus Aminicenantes bacterium]|nr:hypothetical protein [Candidatus Aminicenantes bacterium]
MDTITIRYSFKFGRNKFEVFDLQLDTKNFELLGNTPEVLPAWTKLDFHQCPNCPLKVSEVPRCPLAVNLVNIVKKFDSFISYNETLVVVTTKERIISQVTTVQRAVGSMMGLIIAASGCPHTNYFRPMARFHLPLANDEETVYRAASMYLLAQYFIKNNGEAVDFDLSGLKSIYRNIQLINYTVAERLRAASKSDSVLNAIVDLDVYAQTLTIVIEDSLEELQSIYRPYIDKNPISGGLLSG